jgi:hypothetical protein
VARVAPILCVVQFFIVAVANADEEGLRDLYFGESLFYAKQGEFFNALERLDTELGQYYRLDEPYLDTLHLVVGDAEFSVGDFELNYRMHHRAGRAISAVLEGNVDELVRNEAAFRLARIHFQKGQAEDALHALNRIQGRAPEHLLDEIEFLRANVFLALDRVPEAIDVLERIENAEGLEGFAAYNLGIAYLRNGEQQEALEQLGRAGVVEVIDEGGRSIRDKSNLVLGTLLLEDRQFAAAQSALERVRLAGPLSNQALLSAGWADFSAENYQRAVVPWGILAGRESTDAAVQEARLALPYAYSQLEVYGRSAVLYGEALESFSDELRKVDESIKSIRDGKFLEALVREEIRQNKDWVIGLRSLPESPETYYLMELSASHDFQTGLQNYLDLEDLRERLASWQHSFDAFEDMIAVRRDYYEPLLPDIDQQFRELDSRILLRQEQYRLLNQRLQDLLVAPRPDFLSTDEERLLIGQLDRLEARLGNDSRPEAAGLRHRIDRLRGQVIWTVRIEYHDRLTEFAEHLVDLQSAMDVMTEQYESFVRIRQAALHSFEGYDRPITRMRTRVREALDRVKLLMGRQGHALELVAIDELLERRRRLDDYRNQARYALADSYDRATKGQVSRAEP